MPHIPQQFRPVPGDNKNPGMLAPLASAIEDLPVTPSPPSEKPNVPLSGKPRVRSKHGLERISMRKFEKSPDEIAAIMEQ